MLLIDRVDYQVTSPMYPVELNFLLKTVTKQKAIFCRAAYSDFFAKVNIYIDVALFYFCSCLERVKCYDLSFSLVYL